MNEKQINKWIKTIKIYSRPSKSQEVRLWREYSKTTKYITRGELYNENKIES